MSSRFTLAVLLVLGIIGFVLVATAGDEGPMLVETVTAERLTTWVPEGWEVNPNLRFEYRPPGEVDPSGFERWTVARACGPQGCESRSLAEWMALAPELPSFVGVLEPDSGLEIIDDRRGDDYRAITTRTSAGTTLVVVAVFDDGADDYIECGVAVGRNGDQRLAEQVIEICRETQRL